MPRTLEYKEPAKQQQPIPTAVVYKCAFEEKQDSENDFRRKERM